MTWIQTYTGRPVSFLVPDPAEITLDDIAVGLARTARFGGHTSSFYSVAQHCVLVCDIITEASPKDYAAQMWGLLHDAHEYVTGDLPTPLQEAIAVLIPAHVPHPLRVIQLKLDIAIAKAFEIDLADIEAVKPLVKRADLVALATERKQLLTPPPIDWKIALPPPADIPITPVSPTHAECMWRAYFERKLAAYRRHHGLPASATAAE